ncbi:General transcription repressor [Coelomomyces lativittatus]|nr:General transcription repressor [Coelomomyces lativittatus]KAJ1518211.1 General transcription repressor [Coelomomyces lativittatus]
MTQNTAIHSNESISPLSHHQQREKMLSQPPTSQPSDEVNVALQIPFNFSQESTVFIKENPSLTQQISASVIHHNQDGSAPSRIPSFRPLLPSVVSSLTNSSSSFLSSTSIPSNPTSTSSHPSSFSSCNLNQSEFSCLGNPEIEQVALVHFKEGQGWYLNFNPTVPRQIDIASLHTLKHTSVVSCVCFSPNGEYLVSGCENAVMVWNVHSGVHVTTLEHHSEDNRDSFYVFSLAFSPDSKILASGSEDGKIRLWDFHQFKKIQIFEVHEESIKSLDFSPDGKYLVSGSNNETARIWSVHDGLCVHILKHEKMNSHALPEKDKYEVKNNDKDEVKSEYKNEDEDEDEDEGEGEDEESFIDPPLHVNSVAFSPESKYVATGSSDSVQIYSVLTGFLLDKLEGHDDIVFSVAFRPDGKQVASASLDTYIRLWEVPDYSKSIYAKAVCTMSLQGHTDFVLNVTYSPDGQYLISGSKDRSFQIWDVRNGTSLLALKGHRNTIISVDMSSSGKYIATGSGDSTAKIWRCDFLEQLNAKKEII